MVFCAAVGYCNEPGKSQDISFYRLPRDQTLKAKWLQRLKRDNLPSEKNIRVCHPHFEDECFKRDLEVFNKSTVKIFNGCLFSYFVTSCKKLGEGENIFHKTVSATSSSADVVYTDGSIKFQLHQYSYSQ